MNTASRGIANTIGVAGNLSSNVISASTSIDGSGISGLGNLAKSVGRMTSSRGNKPTPMESYVGMVAHDNSKAPTMA